jgi:C-terminal processing protease CtpA/Prc
MAIVLLGNQWKAFAGEKAAPQSGSIAGSVVNVGEKPVVGAMVVVCDAESGIPVMREDSRPFTDHWPGGGRESDWAFAVTNDSGRFLIEGLKQGTYRLVAQSRMDVEEATKSPLGQAGSEVYLRGVADNVQVPSDAANAVALRPLGEASLHVRATSTDRSPLLLLSTSAPGADPTLATGAIVGGFLRHLVGGFPMKGNDVLVRGLPKGKVYCFLTVMADDPGFGAGAANLNGAKGDSPIFADTKIGTVPQINVPIYATWAKPRPEPPKHLASLMDELRELRKTADGGRFVAEQLPDLRLVPLPSSFHRFAQLARFFERPIEMPSGHKTTFGDVMAAMQHLQIERAVQRGDERTVKDVAADLTFLQLDPSHRPSEPKRDRSVSYEKAFHDLYEVLGKEYPCFELKGIDWPEVGRVMLPRVKAVKTDEEFLLLCAELVARLEDSHAQVIPGAAPLPKVEFPRWDPGLACLMDDRGKPVVYYVDPGGPAEKAGIRLGATVVSINGKPAEDALREREAHLKKYVGFSSSRYLRYQAARCFLQQRENSVLVRLELRDPQGNSQDLQLPASQDVRYLPRLPVPIKGISDTSDVSWTRLDSGIGYIYVRRIGDGLIDSLDRAVGQLQDVKGLIIDVRGNSGGGFDDRRSHLNFDLNRQGEEPKRPRYVGPIALLIDARCISAGEGWASWFVANKRARFFGEATAGASARKKAYTLTNGLFEVRFPVKAYQGFLDRPIERRGLEPDVPVMPNRADLAKGRDTVLRAAEAYLLQNE